MREYEVAFRSHDAGGVQYVNTFAIKVETTGPDLTEASLGAVASQLDTWLKAAYRGLLHSSYTWDDILIRRILPDDGSEFTRAIGLAGLLNGTGAVAVPKELAMVLTLKTDTATRRGRGRMFLPSPRNVGYLGDVTSWASGTDWYNFVGVFGDALLAGRTFSEGVVEYHISTRVWSRAGATTHDVVAYVRRLPYHFLRSRSTAP